MFIFSFLPAAGFQGFSVLGFGVLSFNLIFKITEGPVASDLDNLLVSCVVNSVFFPCSWYDLENILFTNGLFWKINCTVVK